MSKIHAAKASLEAIVMILESVHGQHNSAAYKIARGALSEIGDISYSAVDHDILTALKDCVALLERVFPNPAPNGQIENARAAIRKAESP